MTSSLNNYPNTFQTNPSPLQTNSTNPTTSMTTNPTTLNKSAKGTVIFRPVQAKFNQDNNWILKMNPYCKIKLGWKTAKTHVAYRQGISPEWNDAIVLHRKKDEEFAKIKVKARNTFGLDDNLGQTKIPLDEVVRMGKTSKWFNLYKDNKITGEILLNMEFTTQSLME